jgi:hypothetical protein
MPLAEVFRNLSQSILGTENPFAEPDYLSSQANAIMKEITTNLLQNLSHGHVFHLTLLREQPPLLEDMKI